MASGTFTVNGNITTPQWPVTKTSVLDPVDWTLVGAANRAAAIDECLAESDPVTESDYLQADPAVSRDVDNYFTIDVSDIPNQEFTRIRFHAYAEAREGDAQLLCYFNAADITGFQTNALVESQGNPQFFAKQWYATTWKVVPAEWTQAKFAASECLIRATDVYTPSDRIIIYALFFEIEWVTSTNLAALAEPTRITQIFVNDGINLTDYRKLSNQTLAAATSYDIGNNAADMPRGIIHIAGRLYTYFDRSGTAYYAISYKDGTEWLGGDMAAISAFDTYTLKHVVQLGRWQYAVLYKSSALYFSRNTAGDTTTWSAPVQVVGSLASEPAAWLVPANDGRIHCYYQVGSATPLVLTTSRLDGASWA